MMVHFSCGYNFPQASQLTDLKMEVAILILFPLSNSVIIELLIFSSKCETIHRSCAHLQNGKVYLFEM